MENEFHFTAADIAKIQSGQPVARLVATGKPDDVRMAGIVLIRTTPEVYIAALRDIEHFRMSKEVIHMHRFSSPPVESDLIEFPLPDFTKSELLACRPGHCSIKMPAEEMEILRKGIDWNAPDATERAAPLIRQRIVAYIYRYLREGDSALAVYYDTPAPYSVAEGLHSLIGNETHIAQSMPELIRFASEFPARRPAGTEDFLYWQEAAFGLKHVLRTQHVLIQKLPEGRYAIISKMLFATHYFRAAIEYSYIYPVRTPSGEPAIYVATSQRSYVDGMTGVKGAIIHRVAESRSPATLANNLRLAKEFLEHRR
ncbi:MAG TPA: hypothetical protein VMT15_02375 [Bryobacteraceae bacterium]|nr:hypothetical protein [Bryobacteraceae bacterium]